MCVVLAQDGDPAHELSSIDRFDYNTNNPWSFEASLEPFHKLSEFYYRMQIMAATGIAAEKANDMCHCVLAVAFCCNMAHCGRPTADLDFCINR